MSCVDITLLNHRTRAYDKRRLRTHLERKLQNLGIAQPQFHQDALYVSLEGLKAVPNDELAHEVFYFDYGGVSAHA
jgi:hypothetical protein